MEGRRVAAAARTGGGKWEEERKLRFCNRNADVFAVTARYCVAALGAAKGLWLLDVKPECGRGDDGRGSEDASPLHATVGGMETEAKTFGELLATCHFRCGLT